MTDKEIKETFKLAKQVNTATDWEGIINQFDLQQLSSKPKQTR